MRRIGTIVATALVLAALPAAAQDWPARPVTMVIPFAPGGALDVVARIVGPRLSEILGKPVIIENVGGAGGMTGGQRIAKAAPDGYQFVFGGTSTHAINQTLYKNPLYNAATDFAPVALMIEQPVVLITRPDLPVGNLKEFIAYTKANQAKMQYGSSGAGSTVHLACSLLNAKIGAEVTHVPYRGSAPATNDLIGGQIDYVCGNLGAAIALITGKQVKALALLSKERSPLMPELATAHEQGLADYDVTTWTAFFLPKGAPKEIVDKLNAVTHAAMDTPAIKSRMLEIGVTGIAPERRSAEYLAKFVIDEVARWEGPIKSGGLQVD